MRYHPCPLLSATLLISVASRIRRYDMRAGTRTIRRRGRASVRECPRESAETRRDAAVLPVNEPGNPIARSNILQLRRNINF